MADVFPVDAPLYYDAAGNLREAVGVRVMPGATYLDAAGNVRGAIGVNIVGGGGGLPSDQAAVADGTTVTLLPASGTTPAQGAANVAVADNVATFRLAANRVALTTGATAPVQNSAGAAIATGTITIGANAITHIRLPATVAGVSNGGTLSVRNSAGADAHPATAVVTAGVLAGVNLAATAAIVDNGDTITATGGQTIDVTVADGVASMTVESNEPFWEPFTVTAGELDGRGYERGVAGSITNEPVEGYSVFEVRTYGGDFRLVIEGPQPLASDGLLNALVGINSNDYSLSSITSYCYAGGTWSTTLEAQGVPAWTTGQQVPIVIIPQ